MTEVLLSPVTRKAALNAITGLGKLGIFAATSIFAGKVFKVAADEYLAVLSQDFRQIKSIANG
jgi:hypothetical protein